jgi:hypothetical protein
MSTQESKCISAEVVMRVHRATGMPSQHCKQHLERLSPTHITKLLDATARQRGPTYHDPVEDDPLLSGIFQQARREAQALADEEIERRREEYRRDGLESVEFLLKRGHCHRVWHIMQRLLREQHGIEWFTPAQMSPGVCMD